MLVSFLISCSVNPIWTIETASLFILDVTPEAFFGSAQGLVFIIRDYDTIGANDTLGKVDVAQEDLLNGDGERKEFKLLESSSKNEKQPVSILCVYRSEENSWSLGGLSPCMSYTSAGNACLAIPKGHRRRRHFH